MKTDVSPSTEKWLFAILVIILVALELLCARLAYNTLGEVTSMLYFLAVGLNLVFILLAFRSRSIATIMILLLALIIIPYQFYLGNRLVRVQSEASRIVTYAYEEKTASGAYPPTLEDYEFHDAEMEPYIQRYDVEPDGGGFSLYYRVGTENTSHHYISQTGWGYYPD